MIVERLSWSLPTQGFPGATVESCGNGSTYRQVARVVTAGKIDAPSLKGPARLWGSRRIMYSW